MHGAGRSRITHPFATLTTKQSLMDPVRLACVKHAASVHPEPESNPPQKNAKRHRQMTLKTKIDEHVLKEGRPQKTSPLIKPSRVPSHHTSGQARNELAIIDYKEVVQTRS